MPQTIVVVLVIVEEARAWFITICLTIYVILYPLNLLAVYTHNMYIIPLIHSSQCRVKFSSKLLGIGCHVGDQMPYLLRGFVNQCSSTNYVNHALIHWKQAFIEVLDQQLVRNLVMGATRVKLLESLPIFMKCLTMLLPYATYFLSYNNNP